MSLRPMTPFSRFVLLWVGEEEAPMTDGARTTTETPPPDAGRAYRQREAAVMGPKEATWLAWYMCFLSLGLTALGLMLLVLSREHHGGLVFEQWAEDAPVAGGLSALGA